MTWLAHNRASLGQQQLQQQLEELRARLERMRLVGKLSNGNF